MALLATMLARDGDFKPSPAVFEVSDTAPNVAESLLSKMEEFRLTFKMLEMQSFEVAKLLLERDPDFHFTEGYGSWSAQFAVHS